MKGPLFALLLLTMTGCSGERLGPLPRSEIDLTVAPIGDECLLSIMGQRFVTQRLVSADFSRLLASLRHRLIVLRFEEDTPYRCIGGAIIQLQRSRARFRAPQIPSE